MILTHMILTLAAISAVMFTIDALVNRILARRRAKAAQHQMLCQDPRQARHMIRMYCASAAEANERDWINSAHMAATRRKAKAQLR